MMTFNFLACEKCKNEKRKTINGDDLLYAMNTLGFEEYIDILKAYLQKYREVDIIYHLILKCSLGHKND